MQGQGFMAVNQPKFEEGGGEPEDKGGLQLCNGKISIDTTSVGLTLAWTNNYHKSGKFRYWNIFIVPVDYEIKYHEIFSMLKF